MAETLGEKLRDIGARWRSWNHLDSADKVDKLATEADALAAELGTAERALLNKGYRKSCDVPACNCGDQWTHGGHAAARLVEFRETLAEATETNGVILLDALKQLVHERDELVLAVVGFTKAISGVFLSDHEQDSSLNALRRLAARHAQGGVVEK